MAPVYCPLPGPGDILNRFGFGGSELRSDLERYVDLLRTWQAAHNMVSSASLRDVWTRHIADSLQLVKLAPEGFRTWADLGSGAGFPGLVAAIACKTLPESRFILVEANLKKAAFLRAASRETGARATVVAGRIEVFAATAPAVADVVSARALASVVRICELSNALLQPDAVLLLPKGQDFARELQDASRSWAFDVVITPSATDSSGRVLAIRNLRPKVLP